MFWLLFISFFLSFFLFYCLVFSHYIQPFFCIKTELIFNCPIFRKIIYQILLSYLQILFNFFFFFFFFFVISAYFSFVCFVKVAENRLFCVSVSSHCIQAFFMKIDLTVTVLIFVIVKYIKSLLIHPLNSSHA